MEIFKGPGGFKNDLIIGLTLCVAVLGLSSHQQGIQNEIAEEALRLRSTALSEEINQLNILTQKQADVNSSLAEQITFLSGQETWYMQDGIATAYSPYDDQNGIQSSGDPGCTSIGMKPSKNVIAVDPKRIPYHSKIMVIYPDGTIATGVAGDTGGALRSSRTLKVDMFRQTFDEAVEHGKQNVKILWKLQKVPG